MTDIPNGMVVVSATCPDCYNVLVEVIDKGCGIVIECPYCGQQLFIDSNGFVQEL